MTLILAAICKDDICVCADTRYVDQSWNNGFKDGFDKIYKFVSFPLIIFNHGVNKFGEKYWRDYCLDYEKSGKWRGKNLKSISEDFKNFIGSVVLQQLDYNIKQYPDDIDARKTGFALCGKNSLNNDFEIYEYFWNPKPELPEFYPWSGKRLNGFGTGYDKYLKNDIDNLVNWDAFNRVQIKHELEKLFSVARDRKNHIGGKELSDDFKIRSVIE